MIGFGRNAKGLPLSDSPSSLFLFTCEVCMAVLQDLPVEPASLKERKDRARKTKANSWIQC
jgi:hypothetical protein